MKKTLAILGAIAVLAFAVPAIAQQSVEITVPLTLTIPSQFGFTLDKYAHDFGSVQTGAGAETTIGVFCSSNQGSVWYMGIQAAEFVNGSADVLASDPGFTMAGWTWADPPSDAAQGVFNYTGPVPSTTMYDWYTSTLAEGGDPFVPLTLGLYVTIPSAQASGLYSTDLVLTMHE